MGARPTRGWGSTNSNIAEVYAPIHYHSTQILSCRCPSCYPLDKRSPETATPHNVESTVRRSNTITRTHQRSAHIRYNSSD